MNKSPKLHGGLGVLSRLRRYIGLHAEKHILRSQILRKQRQAVQGFCFLTYFLSPDFLSLLQRAAHLIEKDERSAEIVRGYVQAVVEIESAAKLSALTGSGMQIGAYYDLLPSEADSELAEVSFACALVQFAVCRKLLLRLSERCPNRRDTETEMRIKQIAIRAMHGFTVRAELGERYSYEIECKLKNGAFDC